MLPLARTSSVSNHTSLPLTAAASGAIIGHTLLTRYINFHNVTDTELPKSKKAKLGTGRIRPSTVSLSSALLF